MANKNSERTSLMKKNFIKLRASGMSIQDIAEKYGMTARNIYFHLQEIADENHVTRDELLFVPQKTHHIRKSTSKKLSKEAISHEELKKDFSDMLEKVDDIIEKIDTTIADTTIAANTEEIYDE